MKIVNGVPESSTNATTNIYKNSELKSPENTYINHSYIDDVLIVEEHGNSAKIEVTGYSADIEKLIKMVI